MWVLVLILTIPVQPGVLKEFEMKTPVEKYPTHELCMSEGKRIKAELDLAYPNEKDKLKFECWVRRKDVS